MEFNITEISSLIKDEIKRYRSEIDVAMVGRVLEVGDGIATICGLDNAMAGEMLMFEGGVAGEVFNLEEESIGAVIYGDYKQIKESSPVRSTGKMLSVPVGFELMGRVVNALCEPIDGAGAIGCQDSRPVETPAPGIAARQPVYQPLNTGLKCIDSMIPIGKGQRELIIGDRKTGKTAIALDTIINQRGKDVICIYVAIGQKESTVAEVVRTLREHGAMEHTIVVAASASESAAMQYIAPYVGTAIAEHFMYKHGKDALCVYDDLTKHANAYRELSLLLRRPPGREAYPGDIFYLHSRLLERSAKVTEKLGGGSITALPIVETLEGQVSAYIPTNIISITDGQIYLQRNLFLAGVRPAVDVGISVSRVGGDAQPAAMKKIAPKLRLDLAMFRELQDFARLGTELDAAAQKQLDQGYRMVEILKQKQYSPLSVAEMAMSLFAADQGYLDDVDLDKVVNFESALHAYLRSSQTELTDKINASGDFNDEIEAGLRAAVEDFKATGTW